MQNVDPQQRPVTAPADLGRHGRFEIAAVVVTGVLHLVASALDLSYLLIPGVALAWMGYIVYRARTDAGFLRRAGFRREGLAGTMRATTVVAAMALVVMAIYAGTAGQLQLHVDMLPLLMLYPIWGLVQQFLVQGLVAANLLEREVSPAVVVLTCGVLFALVHVPSWDLAAGTLVMGLVFSALFVRYRNLWTLGLWHGWLGVFYYFWVLGRNPWLYVVG